MAVHNDAVEVEENSGSSISSDSSDSVDFSSSKKKEQREAPKRGRPRGRPRKSVVGERTPPQPRKKQSKKEFKSPEKP